MNMLDGKVAVVTGGSSGIGLAIAMLFAAEGARLVITGRNARALDQAAALVGPGTLAIAGDVADPDHHAEVAETLSTAASTRLSISRVSSSLSWSVPAGNRSSASTCCSIILREAWRARSRRRLVAMRLR